MRLIAFITNTAEVRKILDHIGVAPQPPRITPARGLPLWDNCDAPTDEVPDAHCHCLIGIKQRSQNLTIVPISASIGDRQNQRLKPAVG